MSSRSHFISSHRNLVPSHPIPRKSGPVRSHLTKILVPSHPIPQRSHPIPVPRRDGTGPGRDILILAVSLIIQSDQDSETFLLTEAHHKFIRAYDSDIFLEDCYFYDTS